MYKFEILKTTNAREGKPYHWYYWRIRACNGEIILTSKKTKSNPTQTVENLVHGLSMRHAVIKDLTKE